jgi:hypothetical protein
MHGQLGSHFTLKTETVRTSETSVIHFNGTITTLTCLMPRLRLEVLQDFVVSWVPVLFVRFYRLEHKWVKKCSLSIASREGWDNKLTKSIMEVTVVPKSLYAKTQCLKLSTKLQLSSLDSVGRYDESTHLDGRIGTLLFGCGLTKIVSSCVVHAKRRSLNLGLYSIAKSNKTRCTELLQLASSKCRASKLYLRALTCSNFNSGSSKSDGCFECNSYIHSYRYCGVAKR